MTPKKKQPIFDELFSDCYRKDYYVYVWFAMNSIDMSDYLPFNDDLDLWIQSSGYPFYVGKGCGARYRDTYNRRDDVKCFLQEHEWYPQIVISGLTETVALALEAALKFSLKVRGIHLLDHEHSILSENSFVAVSYANFKSIADCKTIFG